MKVQTILRLIFDGMRNIKENISISLSALIVTYISLLIFVLSLMLMINIENNIDRVANEPEIEIFMKNDVTDDEKQIIEDFLDRQDFIDSYKKISKEEAYKRFIDMIGQDAKINLPLNSDFLPESYIVYLNDTEVIDEFISELEQLKQIESISYSKELTDFILSLSKSMKKIANITLALLAVFAFLIHFNLIKISTYSRTKEIRLMRLMGARNDYIILPFIVEGVIITFVSSILAYISSFFIYNYIAQNFSEYIKASIFNFFTLVDYSILNANIIIYLIIITVVFGFLSSYIAAKMNLRNEGESKIES